jgi:putative ABC transport system substrate-binding protein
VLRGEPPAGIPVATPRFELVVDLRVAQELGIDVPLAVLARADQVLR